MTNTGKVTIEISPESADALALVSSLKTDWDVAPTMIRGSKKTPGQLGRPPPDPKKKKPNISTEGLPGAKKRKRAHEEEFADMSAEKLNDKDYRKTARGNYAIKLKMQQMFDKDLELFPLARTFDPQTLKCRLKDEGAQLLAWDQFLDAAPAYMAAVFLAADSFWMFLSDFECAWHVFYIVCSHMFPLHPTQSLQLVPFQVLPCAQCRWLGQDRAQDVFHHGISISWESSSACCLGEMPQGDFRLRECFSSSGCQWERQVEWWWICAPCWGAVAAVSCLCEQVISRSTNYTALQSHFMV